MKKNTLFVLLLSVLLTTGCTLSMEEYVIPEEEQGFEEPITEETEYGNITYQFNEGVRRITDNVMEYIVSVQADTILYFADNTPKNWLPQTGDLLNAGCSRMMPLGLAHRVLSVTKENGMYKVVTTKAGRDEIFKELDYEIKFDYDVPDVPLYDSLEIVEQGIDTANFYITDFSVLDRQKGIKSSNPLYIRKTRDDPAQKTEEESWDHNINIDVGNTKMREKGFGGFLNMRWRHSTKIIYYEQEKKSEDYRRTWRETYCADTITCKIGATWTKGLVDTDDDVSKDVWLDEDGVKKNWSKFKDEIARLKNDIKNDIKNKKKLHAPSIHVPIGTTGLFFVVNFTPQLSFTGTAYGTCEIVCLNEVKREETIYDKKDTIIPDNPKIRPSKSVVNNFAVGGEANVELTLGIEAGVEHASGVGAVIGGQVGIGVDFNYQHEFYSATNTYPSTEDTNYLRLYIPLRVYLKFYWSPLGVELVAAPFYFIDTKVELRRTHFNPKIDKEKLAFNKKLRDIDVYYELVDMHTTEEKLCYHTTMAWSDYFMFTKFHEMEKTYPVLRVYNRDLNGDFVEFYPGQLNKRTKPSFEKGKKYDVYFLPEELPEGWMDQSLVCVPALYEASENTTMEFRDSKHTFAKKEPTITFQSKSTRVRACTVPEYYSHDLLITDPTEVNEEFHSDFPSVPYNYYADQFWFYECWHVFDFKDTESIDEWGVVMTLYEGVNYGAQKPKTKKVRVFKRKEGEPFTKEGKKAIVMRFVSTRAPKTYPECYVLKSEIYVDMYDGNTKKFSGGSSRLGDNCKKVITDYPEADRNMIDM